MKLAFPRIIGKLCEKIAEYSVYLLTSRQYSAEEIFALSTENREIDTIKDKYIKDTFFGVVEHQDDIDELISKFSSGWKISRFSNATRSAIRLCVYEMLYCNDIPNSVSINEAVELVKKFDDPKSRAFTNGVLNNIKNEIEQNNG